MSELKVVDLDKMLTIAEMFGPTLQGEGPSLGKPAMFLRLGLCNLDCSWCDTPFTWDWTGKNGVAYDKDKELERLPISSIISWLDEAGTPRLVVTGGEPLVQRVGVVNLVQRMQSDVPWCAVEVETNGTIEPPYGIRDLVQWNVSPKLKTSGVADDKRYNPDAIEALSYCANHAFKFVVCDVKEDVAEVIDLMDTHNINPGSIYLMPEGRSPEEINRRLPELFEVATSLGVNVTTRLHVLAFGDKRGV